MLETILTWLGGFIVLLGSGVFVVRYIKLRTKEITDEISGD